ncbi:hypothetical protein CC1G_10784 [Coprinopsis cinerea okayama7|uniref:Uncharacterized protein n=1 Tax=Coprinopsis cinerea (strain Okayama-7 / 130 / ATCC MYA-4618 / FGSC 9003) TaxID=240176 RepID=A8NMG6_COPC7|nr:hypothetical protein CC1G_10784 [Coprinopsis cinerea okayama7\|eukprot:XP_001834910.2 hypothetical protein CC1G_10784 [Coprinopsis cinerea okayama7\
MIFGANPGRNTHGPNLKSPGPNGHQGVCRRGLDFFPELPELVMEDYAFSLGTVDNGEVDGKQRRHLSEWTTDAVRRSRMSFLRGGIQDVSAILLPSDCSTPAMVRVALKPGMDRLDSVEGLETEPWIGSVEGTIRLSILPVYSLADGRCWIMLSAREVEEGSPRNPTLTRMTSSWSRSVLRTKGACLVLTTNAIGHLQDSEPGDFELFAVGFVSQLFDRVTEVLCSQALSRVQTVVHLPEALRHVHSFGGNRRSNGFGARTRNSLTKAWMMIERGYDWVTGVLLVNDRSSVVMVPVPLRRCSERGAGISATIPTIYLPVGDERHTWRADHLKINDGKDAVGLSVNGEGRRQNRVMEAIVGNAGRYIGQEGGILVILKDKEGTLVDATDDDVGQRTRETNTDNGFQKLDEKGTRC